VLTAITVIIIVTIKNNASEILDFYLSVSPAGSGGKVEQMGWAMSGAESPLAAA
jgi:hypothetical protein